MRKMRILCCCLVLVLVQCRCRTSNHGETPKAGGSVAADPECAVPRNKAPVSEVLGLLSSSNSDDRLAAASQLGDYGCAAAPAAPALARALKDPVSMVRELAALALGKIGPHAKSATPALIAALRDRHPPARREAAAALAKLGPEAVEKTLVRTAPKEYPRQIQELAFKAFSTEWPTVVPGALRCLEKQKDPWLRGTGAYMLGRMKTCAPSATPELLAQAVRGLIRALARDPDPEVRADSAGALSRLGSGATEQTGVCKQIQDDREPVPTALRALARAVEDPSSGVRKAAVLALGSFYNHRTRSLVLPAVRRAKNDPDNKVRDTARLKLERFEIYDRLEREAREAREAEREAAEPR